MQEVEIWPYEEMVYVQLGICPEKWKAKKNCWDFEIQTDHLISARRQDLVIVNKKKKKRKKKDKWSNSGLCRSGWPEGKTERKWKAR